jgi:hypothetical protein
MPEDFPRPRKLPERLWKRPERFWKLPERFWPCPERFPKCPEGFWELAEGFPKGPEGFRELPEEFRKRPEGLRKPPERVWDLPEEFRRTFQRLGKLPEAFWKLPDRGPAPTCIACRGKPLSSKRSSLSSPEGAAACSLGCQPQVGGKPKNLKPRRGDGKAGAAVAPSGLFLLFPWFQGLAPQATCCPDLWG